MNALIRFRLHLLGKRRAATEPATAESIRAHHRLQGVRFGGDRGGIEAAPAPVYCDRDLTGHDIDPRLHYVGVLPYHPHRFARESAARNARSSDHE